METVKATLGSMSSGHAPLPNNYMAEKSLGPLRFPYYKISYQTTVGRNLLVLIAPRTLIESDLSSVGEVHIQLARVDHRVPWPTQRER